MNLLATVGAEAKRRFLGLRSNCELCARFLFGEKGQGTTEYAILVGVLVVIAIIAVTAFRGKLQSLWDGIANGINGL